jgi:hypothetical protein
MPFAKHDLASSQKEKRVDAYKHPKNKMWKEKKNPSKFTTMKNQFNHSIHATTRIKQSP